MTPDVDFDKYKDGLVPAVVQDSRTSKVLMLGFMDREALARTVATGRVTFYSRSRQRLWTKGETSGNFLQLVRLNVDCDRDTLLVQAEPAGPVCHTGSTSCFGTAIAGSGADVLYDLERVIASRQTEPDENSYTSGLFAAGINRIAQKVGEEAVELVIEAKDENIDKFKSEAADLTFHLLVLLRAKGVGLDDVFEILAERRR
ncbi:MAG: bifunctional phosphoribosyl-AMP cyclohydrolase/phosphoribosyl-ATP diphosphatase HisIE [Acidobacteriota bacterium]